MISSHGANTRQVSRIFNVREEDILDMSSNVNIFIPDINYKKVIKRIQKNINKYPDIDYTDLKKNIAHVYNVKNEYIHVGNGATEIIYDVISLDCFKNIGIFNPTFSEYERACKINKKNIIDINIDILSEISKYTSIEKFKDVYTIPDMLILCNPNNPTGKIEKLSELLDFCQINNIFLMVDETFIDFMDNEEFSLKNKIENYDKLIIINAVTKFFAMTGARLGYAFCSNFRLSEKLKLRSKPWSINILAEEIMREIVYVDKSFYRNTKRYYKLESQRLYEKYSSKGIKISKSNAPYFSIELDEKINAVKLQKKMLIEDNILLRVLDNYKNISENSIRVAIKEQELNNLVFECICKNII